MTPITCPRSTRVGYALALDVDVTTPLRPRGRHWLVSRDRRIALVEGENIIGRDPEVEVWIDEARVSRRHARIMIDGANVQLEDLGSKNGRRVPTRGQPVL